ncbi:MAG: hypothetical protein FWF51_06150 [Chitinivibrionia bacterium]|nr:hypothetical protein [Chitinivibrionia bacterium]
MQLTEMERAYKSGKFDDNFDFLFQYGIALFKSGILATAAEVLGKALKIKPNHIGVLGLLADVFEETGNPVTAMNVYKLALKLEPENIRLNFGIAGTYMVCGYQKESIEYYKKAIEYIKKSSVYSEHFPTVYSKFLFHLNYVEISREEYFALCQKYRTIWEKEVLPARPNFCETQKIKIGVVSSDFHMHAVSLFVSSLFENYDKSKFEIHLFSTLMREKYDKNTDIFMKQTDKWHDISAMSFLDAANLIKEEKITVLVDLSGHTYGGLHIFGLRPAPVQITYCGYPNTTGLKSIDYRITDEICEPDDAQNYYSEKLFKLNGCFLCYKPDNTMLADCSFEDLQGRPIIFGSFNTLSKMTEKTIKLWSKVINAVPESKLVIKHRFLNDPKLRDITLKRFAENGLLNDRIIIFDYNFDNREHILQYNKIDIALDSFPYNGTTTTCEALYMGVPVITILGDRHVSRVSASLLNAVGLGELAAKNEDDFVKIAVDLAKNTQKLTEIKKNLRKNMENSALMDKKTFTQKWQNAILDMIEEVKMLCFL